ncbi:MAG TPA: hypothetical protein VHH11_14005 [Gammaproteobacteria bacterium]|nr:hypothetical protein [Gammaproteobacteria bacterium]
MSAAHRATGIAYSTILDLAHGVSTPRPRTAFRLEQWSRRAGRSHGVYIDAARTVLDVAPQTGTDG